MNGAQSYAGSPLTSDKVERLAPIRIPLRKPRHPGGKHFYGDIPADSATFAHAELCCTSDPDGAALAPTPEIPVKKWYNTYLYVPEERRAIKDGGQFLERFVQGPDGEWLDVPKARRMAQHIEDARRRDMAAIAERKAIQSGVAFAPGGLGANATGMPQNGMTCYTDPYSGEQLMCYKGELMPKAEIYDRNNIHESEYQRLFDTPGGLDMDNFRVPWPFGTPHRNKKVSMHAYDWFDRQNPFIPSDKSYEMMELPSVYVDKENYNQWRALGGATPGALVADIAIRAQHIDDYPYRI